MNKELANRVLDVIPKDSIGIYDLLPVFKDKKLFADIVEYLSAPYIGKIDIVAAPEAIGWILGVAIAKVLDADFVPLRKGGKLPYPKENTISYTYTDDKHSGKTYEIKKDSIIANEKVLIVDEWVEDGATLKCCIGLLSKIECTITGLATIGIGYNDGTKDWIDTNFIHFIGENI